MAFISPWQPYTAWFALIFFSIIAVFNGFYTFPSANGKNFDARDFVTAYLPFPIYGGLYLFWKVFKKTRFVGSAEADLRSGKAVLDEADRWWPERKAKNWLQKVWFFIA